jgi:phosphatidylinositol 3-kinase
MLMELMLKWQPMDVEDALELLGSKYKNYPKIRSYAISRLRMASNEVIFKSFEMSTFSKFRNLMIYSGPHSVFASACSSSSIRKLQRNKQSTAKSANHQINVNYDP